MQHFVSEMCTYVHIYDRKCCTLWHFSSALWDLWDYENPLHLDVVDRYLRRMGDKTIPDEAPPSLESFIPHESQESIYHNQGVVDSLSRSSINMNKEQEHRRFIGCLIVVIHIRKWRLTACVVMVTSWRLFVMRNKACHPFRLKPYRYIQKYQTHLYICRSMTSLCQGFFVVCVYMYINPDWL